jgi:hypothetical protein
MSLNNNIFNLRKIIISDGINWHIIGILKNPGQIKQHWRFQRNFDSNNIINHFE